MAVDEVYIRREAMRPTLRTWIKHGLLLLLTLITATIAGVLYPFGTIDSMPLADPQSWPELVEFIITLPTRYAGLIGTAIYALLTNTRYLIDGLSFSLSLLFILI